MSDYLDLNNEELLKDFFSEAQQQVENLESNILVIENDPTNHEAIDEIFRAAHTLKGGSATVEMTELTEFTHAVEDLLDELRSGAIPVTEPVVDTLLSAIDIIKVMLEERANGQIYTEDVEPVKNTLKSFIPAKEPKKKKTAPASMQPAPRPVVAPVQTPQEKPVTVSNISEYELLELKQQQYQRYESGVQEIPLHLLIKLADFYNVSLDYLAGRSDEAPAAEKQTG